MTLPGLPLEQRVGREEAGDRQADGNDERGAPRRRRSDRQRQPATDRDPSQLARHHRRQREARLQSGTPQALRQAQSQRRARRASAQRERQPRQPRGRGTKILARPRRGEQNPEGGQQRRHPYPARRFISFLHDPGEAPDRHEPGQLQESGKRQKDDRGR